MPHLEDPELNRILVRDFNKYTYGRWRQQFTEGHYPEEFESCDWRLDHRGKYPRYWSYVKHAACHWVANFTLRLAMLVEPQKGWRIITSEEHSTVWDGEHTLFDFNFLALGVEADVCFQLAYGIKARVFGKAYALPIGRYMRVHQADHCTHDMSKEQKASFRNRNRIRFKRSLIVG